MPSSAVRTFIDPDEYFAGIRNLQVEGPVARRSEFRVEATRMDRSLRFQIRVPRACGRRAAAEGRSPERRT
jgi:hypothetical protein